MAQIIPFLAQISYFFGPNYCVFGPNYNSETEDSKDGDRKSRKGHGLKEAKKARVGKARFTRSSARLMSFEKEENPEELKSKVIRFNRFVSNIRFDPKI